MDTTLHDIDSDMQKLCLQAEFKDYTSQQQKKLANLVNQQQKLQTFASQLAANSNNSTYTSFANSPPTKPLSLSQLHYQNSPQSPQPNNSQFYLHDPPKRTTWREQVSQKIHFLVK